jgi:hypothetical protein
MSDAAAEDREPFDDAPAEFGPAADPDADPRPTASHENELNGLRIRQYTALRRGAFRARSYAMIAAVASGFAGVLLLLIAIAHTAARRGIGAIPIGCALGSCAAIALALHFGRRVRELSREIATPAPLPPTPPGGPDFSTLSDGSQRWKNLEDIL